MVFTIETYIAQNRRTTIRKLFSKKTKGKSMNPDGYFFAWYPVKTFKFWSKRMLFTGWEWMKYVSYIDTTYNGRTYSKMTKKDVLRMKDEHIGK